MKVNTPEYLKYGLSLYLCTKHNVLKM